jgi:uncharacterized protein with GYD domain
MDPSVTWEVTVGKYLLEVNYTSEGAKGLLKEGGVSRRTMVEKLVSNMGGTLESFNFAFGKRDAYCLIDIPNNADIAAISMTVGASGGAVTRTVVLLTPEEVDEATQKTVEYRAPGA